jgi:hypothetical protein
MREHTLNPKQHRRFIATTDSDHDYPIFPDLAKTMTPDGPNQLMLGITFLKRGTSHILLRIRRTSRFAYCSWIRLGKQLREAYGKQRAFREPFLGGPSDDRRKVASCRRGWGSESDHDTPISDMADPGACVRRTSGDGSIVLHKCFRT